MLTKPDLAQRPYWPEDPEMPYDPWRVYSEDGASISDSVSTSEATSSKPPPTPLNSNVHSQMRPPLLSSVHDDIQTLSGQYTSERLRGAGSGSSSTSTVGLTEAMRAMMYKQEYGRELSTLNENYHLPVDEEEFERLEKQHRMFISLMGGKYPKQMVKVLLRNTGRRKNVIDLGCGDGSWIKDVGRDFPDSLCVGVDLVPMNDTADIPDNVRSEVDDLNNELEHFYGQFDVVHVRLLSPGIRDYHNLIHKIARMLRTGGIVELVEYDWRNYDKDGRLIEIDLTKPLGPPYWSTITAYIRQALKAAGGDLDAAECMYDWVRSHGAFQDVEYRETWLRTVGPMGGPLSEEADAAMRANNRAAMRGRKPALLKAGLPEYMYDYLESHVDAEIEAGAITQYNRLRTVVATRNDVLLPKEII